MRKYAIILTALILQAFFSPAGPARAEVRVMEGDSYTLEAEPYLRTDFYMMDNTVDLDTKKRDDRVQYIGIDYGLAFDFRMKDGGPRIFFMLERNGFYDYTAPVVIHNTLNTYLGKVGGYTNYELLPKVKEYWGDVSVAPSEEIRFRGGLFKYEVGHGISLNGSYQNYGMEIYSESDSFSWNVYTCWPDYSNKQLLGPYIYQEKPQGVDWEHSKSYFLAADMKASAGCLSVEPYVGLLMDFSEGKRLSFFQTPTRDDVLGTAGISVDFTLGDFEASVEWARNFGHANSSDPVFPEVEHMGYAVYADASYTFGDFVPRSRFIYGSGNKLTTDMITNGDTQYPGSKNNAFSVYSPFNAFLADSIYPGILTLPIVAMGNGNAMNYGVRRAGTFGDPAQIENLTLVDVGFDYMFRDGKTTVSFDWWYIANSEKGIGMYNNVPKVISPDLGNEVDLNLRHLLTKQVKLNFLGGVFFPGAAYREERTDINGSLFTPFVRGDGKADPAYQLEMGVEIIF